MDPIAGIHAAVTRRTADRLPEAGWYPEERIALAAALAAYTAGCARAIAEDGTLGRIASGYWGDFVVLSEDLFALDDPVGIARTQVDLTIVAGEIVYSRRPDE